MLSHKDLKAKALDKDLDKIGFLSDAAEAMGRRLSGPAVAITFLALCAGIAATQIGSSGLSDTVLLLAASVIGGYMALNIGANDVANNVGPAVGARVVSLTGALIIAAICESAGALLAGSEVISTVSGNILSPRDVPDNFAFTLAMLTALAASALWINLATLVGAPVSTTHSIIGGIVGAGIAVSGFAVINWTTISTIAVTWVLSPVLSGVIAAALMAFMNARVIYNENKLDAARFWLPVLLGVMGAIFVGYVALKAMDHIWHVPDWLAVSLSVLTGSGLWWFYRGVVVKQIDALENPTGAMRILFAVPLMITAGMLSFAHGANDVANAIGPLAAIVLSRSSEVADLSFWYLGGANSDIPLWVRAVGAFGISAGLLLFGRRIVTVVGKKITKLSPVRAFCITLAAAATVLAASGFGLPVSSTHTAVGAVFGVGFYREWYRNRYVADQGRMKPRKWLNREERRRRLLVRRANLLTIIAAWTVTVPASALLAAALYKILELILA
ncbi:inorganic phosphate transporter [Roseibium salinum]|uniref:Phosphate transporter n=1 Tax=Roseibium salinum TaxID=1604349 RepID=A0ABT3R169_9HYPH|nr:inorganic phosphate transporter [Roseibium sp. DSM 29163]MCX2722968.1 inorganic phosphate transporter [Roseibium sp. DSM 29163]